MNANHLTLSPGRSLVLAEIGEPSNNDLRLLVVEAMPQGAPEQTPVGLATPIRPGDLSRGFELIWWRYVAYSVRNESYFQPEVSEQLGHGFLGTRQDTAFLNYVRGTTFADDQHPGPLEHWFLYTGWHCIDVVSDTAPEVRELSPEEVQAIVQPMNR
jgi:hypothetical protein